MKQEIAEAVARWRQHRSGDGSADQSPYWFRSQGGDVTLLTSWVQDDLELLADAFVAAHPDIGVPLDD